MFRISFLAILFITFSSYSETSELELKVCCENIGCFSNAPPFQYFPLPQCSTTGGFGDDFNSLPVYYTMFTRQNPTDGESMDLHTIPSVFDGFRTTVFISHGYLADTHYLWMTTLKDSFLRKDDMNVVLINWGWESINANYLQSASNTRSVGALTSLLIQKILQEPNTDPARFWCAGHSLGSHVCGHTGMKMPPNQPIQRIIGMDPAGPGFEENSDLLVGLNPTAAVYVDAIHTDRTLGTERALGHIDFYPTGYEYQIDTTFTSAFQPGVICESVCMHHRSIDFVIASLNGDINCFPTDTNCTLSPPKYPDDLEISCKEVPGCLAYMGFYAPVGCMKTGVHSLKVNKSPPFC